MAFRDYENYDMMGLAELIQRRAVTASEVLNAAIERIERWNPQINAVVQRMDDEARIQINRGLPAVASDAGQRIVALEIPLRAITALIARGWPLA